MIKINHVMEINQEAPVVQKNEIRIDASSDRVWEVLTNIENWDAWNNRIKNPILRNELRVGTIFSWKTGGSKIKSKLHTVLPNKKFGWTGETFGATAIHNWYIEPTENGTKVKVEESMEGWLIALMKKKLNQQLAEGIEFWLEQLKLESEK